MRLTTKSRYGTRLIIDIALYAQDKPLRLSEISKRQDISLKYLEKLISKLKKAGFVTSVRGPYGGYMLAKPMNKISIGDIVRVLEESNAITMCTETNNKAEHKCSRSGKCITQHIWMGISKTMFEKLDALTIDKIINLSSSDCVQTALFS